MVVYLAYEYLAYEYLGCLDLYSLPRCTNPYDLCCRPVLPLQLDLYALIRCCTCSSGTHSLHEMWREFCAF